MIRNRLATSWLAALALVILNGVPFASAEESSNREMLGERIDDFTLSDFRGKEFKLSDHADAPAVVVAFLGVECPLAKLYAPRLAQLAKEYESKGVLFVGIDANVQDAVTEMGHYAKQHGVKFPLLKDAGNKVADQFHAERTPEVFILDAGRTVRYVGRIDDQYDIGVARDEPKTRFVADALDAILADKDVEFAWNQSVGCHIGRVREETPNAEVTYANQISRILQKRCVECHREGEIAPFALTNYDEVYGWAEMIDEVVHQNRMPPWFADPTIGEFANDCRLSDEEKDLIHKWMLAGAPLGDEKQLPPSRQFADAAGWGIPEPDVVIPFGDEPFDVPAEGDVEYQYFVVDPGFKEDKWIRAAECRPGNRAVVHHILLFVKPPDAKGTGRHSTIESDWFVATAPGAPPMNLPEGYAKLIPAGSKLVFQMHYTPNGSPQKDLSSVGLVFADPKTVRKEVGTWRAINTRFEIPPGASDHEVQASHTFHRDTDLLALFPHMHLRGKSFTYEMRYPNGEKEMLLSVPHYDFNWQNSYVFGEPKRVPAGSTLVCTAVFDNSEQNPSNPDPTDTVHWGEQTWEEMMIGYYSMVNADQDLTQPERRKTDVFLDKVQSDGPPKPDDVLLNFADKALDSNRDMIAFSIALRRLVPQLDRVDVSVIDGDKLRLQMVAQEQSLDKNVGRDGVAIPARGMAITDIAKGDKTVVHPFLADASGRDLRFMSRSLASSMHVPVTIDGKPATVNFWSNETEAFPAPAVELLEGIAKRMSAGR